MLSTEVQKYRSDGEGSGVVGLGVEWVVQGVVEMKKFGEQKTKNLG